MAVLHSPTLVYMVQKFVWLSMWRCVQARGFHVDPKTKAADLRAEVKLQRGVLEPHIEEHYNKQDEEGGWAMTHVQSLIASGWSIQDAMAHVKNNFNEQAMVGFFVLSLLPPSLHACLKVGVPLVFCCAGGRDDILIRITS